MKINFKELNSDLKNIENLNIDEKVLKIVEVIKNNYGLLNFEDCISLLNNVSKLTIIFRDYLDEHPSLYNDTKKIKDETLKNLVDGYVYINGLEEAKELGIDLESDLLNDKDFLSDINRYDSIDIYINSLNYPVLSREEEQELAKRMKNGDLKARKRLIECNLRLVVSIAARIVRTKGEIIPFMDMIDEGNTGLIHAIDKYDFKKGTKISTYVSSWIINKISCAIDKQSKNIQKPIHYNDAYKKYKQILVLMSNILGRDATKQEVANLLNISLEQLDDFESLQGITISLDTPVSDEDDTKLYEVIADDTLIPVHENYDKKYLKEEMKRIIDSLPSREANIIYSMFYENKTLEQIGKDNNLTRERVRQIANKVIYKLGSRKDIKNLAIYVTDKTIEKNQNSKFVSSDIFSIRKFNKKEDIIKKSNEIKLSPFYEKMKIICNKLKNNKITYDELVIDEKSKTKRKTI